MSNRLTYDPLLVAYLAVELDRALRGRGCAAAPFFAPDLSVVLPFADGIQLRADLHPERGWITVGDDAEAGDEELDAICAGVSAPADERILQIELQVAGRFQDQQRTLILELPTNQWNAILIGGERRIINVLRGRRAGSRSIFPGSGYALPPAPARFGSAAVERSTAEAIWDREIESVATDRRARLIRSFAWTGAPNADWVLAPDSAPERFERWWWLRGQPPAQPGILRTSKGGVPYPFPLEGVEWESCGSLIVAMERASEWATPAEERGEEVTAAERLVRRRIATAERKLASLAQELRSAGEADRLRQMADLILAKIQEVPRGRASAALTDWEGNRIDVALDPALSAAENAARYYDEARRRERAEARIPDLVVRAESELKRYGSALEEVLLGRVPQWLAEELQRRAEHRSDDTADAPSLPYRLFRTSGGLEVRVGRGAKENDRLTFRESSPNDVWLHARSVPGSHVILRWADSEGAPPARDLAEAAQLAAVFSRARTSGTVAVDWTRRKHVRKPRGAAPGLVIPQMVKTIFVEPDERVIERLSS